MGVPKGHEEWFGRLIELDGTYFVFYPDEKPKVTKKEREEYDYIKSLPDQIRYRMLAELDPKKDPNVLMVKGRILLEYSERGYIPMFDVYFAKTRRLTLMPVEAYGFYREWSQWLNRRRRKR